MLLWIDFFGKVKDKAGDMERILKEKDKHGKTYNKCAKFHLYYLVFSFLTILVLVRVFSAPSVIIPFYVGFLVKIFWCMF